MMQCRLKCEKPGDIVYTLTVTMKAEDWERMRDQLDKLAPRPWPVSTLSSQIDDLLGQARKIYWPKEPADTNTD